MLRVFYFKNKDMIQVFPWSKWFFSSGNGRSHWPRSTGHHSDLQTCVSLSSLPAPNPGSLLQMPHSHKKPAQNLCRFGIFLHQNPPGSFFSCIWQVGLRDPGIPWAPSSFDNSFDISYPLVHFGGILWEKRQAEAMEIWDMASLTGEGTASPGDAPQLFLLPAKSQHIPIPHPTICSPSPHPCFEHSKGIIFKISLIFYTSSISFLSSKNFKSSILPP